MRKNEIIEKLEAMGRRLEAQGGDGSGAFAPVSKFAAKAKRKTQNGEEILVWSDAIDAALEESKTVLFEASEKIYFIERPIILDSGMRIKAEKGATIRCVDNMNTCMVRNRNIHCGNPSPLPKGRARDRGVSVAGGVWDFARNGRTDRANGFIDEADSFTGHGAFVFSNIEDLVLRDLTFKNGSFSMAVGDGENLLVEDIHFFRMHSDGLHVYGPFKNVLARRMKGSTGDDFVALTAWDWNTNAPTFGPIDCALIEDVHYEGGFQGMRLFPGVRSYDCGEKVDCPVTNVVFKDIFGICHLEAFAQPDGDTPHNDCVVGEMDWIYFDNISFIAEDYEIDTLKLYGIELDANVKNIFFKDVIGKRLPLIRVGSKAFDYRKLGNEYWKKFPNDGCVVERMVFEDWPEEARRFLVSELSLPLDPSYPKRGQGVVKKMLFTP